MRTVVNLFIVNKMMSDGSDNSVGEKYMCYNNKVLVT